MDQITFSDDQSVESGSKSGRCHWMTLERHYEGHTYASGNVGQLQNQGGSPTMTSSMCCGIEQSSYSCVDLPQTPLNGVQQSLIKNFKGTSTTLASSSISSGNEQLKVYDQSVSSSTSFDSPCFNLLDYLNSAGMTPSCDISGVQFQSSVKNLQTYECSKPHKSTNTTNNPTIIPSSSINDQSCLTWFGANTFQSDPTANTSTPDLQSPVAEQKTNITHFQQCLKPMSKGNNFPPFGPNEFKLTIALSPLDVSMQNVEWMYIDKTGLELALNLNTSFLLEHLYTTYSTSNSIVTMKLPETGREYRICPKDMEMIDVYSGEKIALFRKILVSDLLQPLQTGLMSDFPLLWSPQENDIELVTLDKGKSEYRSIRDTFLCSMPESCVVGIERIQNKKLFVRYAFQKAMLLDKNSGNEESLNEKLLFHGTSTTPPSKIWQSEDGFDLRYSRRGMWGIGSYFAEKASYSDKYAYAYSANYVQFREMLVANVLTGNSKQMPSNRKARQLTRPPVYVEATASNPEVLYDSVTGDTGGSRIYVLYKLDMAYPSYLVRYFKL